MSVYNTIGKSKKQVCLENKSFAYYSWFGWMELKYIEYWINDYVYRIDNAWCPSRWTRFHKSQIFYDKDWEAYFRPWSVKAYFKDCIRM